MSQESCSSSSSISSLCDPALEATIVTIPKRDVTVTDSTETESISKAIPAIRSECIRSARKSLLGIALGTNDGVSADEIQALIKHGTFSYVEQCNEDDIRPFKARLLLLDIKPALPLSYFIWTYYGTTDNSIEVTETSEESFAIDQVHLGKKTHMSYKVDKVGLVRELHNRTAHAWLLNGCKSIARKAMKNLEDIVDQLNISDKLTKHDLASLKLKLLSSGWRPRVIKSELPIDDIDINANELPRNDEEVDRIKRILMDGVVRFDRNMIKATLVCIRSEASKPRLIPVCGVHWLRAAAAVYRNKPINIHASIIEFEQHTDARTAIKHTQLYVMRTNNTLLSTSHGDWELEMVKMCRESFTDMLRDGSLMRLLGRLSEKQLCYVILGNVAEKSNFGGILAAAVLPKDTFDAVIRLATICSNVKGRNKFSPLKNHAMTTISSALRQPSLSTTGRKTSSEVSSLIDTYVKKVAANPDELNAAAFNENVLKEIADKCKSQIASEHHSKRLSAINKQPHEPSPLPPEPHVNSNNNEEERLHGDLDANNSVDYTDYSPANAAVRTSSTSHPIVRPQSSASYGRGISSSPPPPHLPSPPSPLSPLASPFGKPKGKRKRATRPHRSNKQKQDDSVMTDCSVNDDGTIEESSDESVVKKKSRAIFHETTPNEIRLDGNDVLFIKMSGETFLKSCTEMLHQDKWDNCGPVHVMENNGYQLYACVRQDSFNGSVSSVYKSRCDVKRSIEQRDSTHS